MKLASYKTSKGAGYGVVREDGIVDLTRRIGKKYPDLRALLADNALAQAQKIAKAAKRADFKLAKLAFLPVIPNPGKIVCVGLNYEEHRVETGRDKTENPALFLRVPESQVGHRQPIAAVGGADREDRRFAQKAPRKSVEARRAVEQLRKTEPHDAPVIRNLVGELGGGQIGGFPQLAERPGQRGIGGIFDARTRLRRQ